MGALAGLRSNNRAGEGRQVGIRGQKANKGGRVGNSKQREKARMAQTGNFGLCEMSLGEIKGSGMGQLASFCL